MRTKTVYLLTMAFVLVLASASHGTYQAHFYDAEGPYGEYEYESGDAHHLFAGGFGDYANCCSSCQVWVVNDESGVTAACADGYTGVYITDYNPNVDPPIHLYYCYDACAFVNFDAIGLPAPGSGSGQAHGYFSPGAYQADASLSYSGLDFDVDSEQFRFDNEVDMSYNGAEYEVYGVTYADLSLGANSSANEIRSDSAVLFFEMGFGISEW